MADLVFPAPQTLVPIAGSAQAYPVGRIFCVGRNYAAHTREMGGDSGRDPPLFFMKPANAALRAETMPFPKDTNELHHEVELVVALGAGGAIFGYAVGVDLTKRDRQTELKNSGAPWERAKAFERAAPLSPISPASSIAAPSAARIWLSVNGAMKQDSNTAELIWNVAEIVARLNELWEPRAGDLIFTGTPEGVGPLRRGDRVEAGVDGVGALRFTLA